MHVRIVSVGKIKERGIREAVDDYFGRIGRYGKFKEIELRDGPDAELTARFEKAIPHRSRVVAMEVDGKSWSSEQLADYVGRCEGAGIQSLVFLIGGSYGLPAAVRAKADAELSLSKMTLPHRLARLLLAEQVYRAFTILRNEPYNH